MSKIEMLRVLINQRLTAAAEEIFGVFGRTIAEYEEEISRSKLEIDRQRRLLDLSRQPQISLQVSSSALSEQQEWSSNLDLDEIKPPHIKEEEEEEEEELWPPRREETPQTAEQNDVKFVLFQSGGVRNEHDNDHMTSSLSKLPCQDLEDSELDPQPGTSVQQTCSDLDDDDAPEASDPPSEISRQDLKRCPSLPELTIKESFPNLPGFVTTRRQRNSRNMKFQDECPNRRNGQSKKSVLDHWHTLGGKRETGNS
ncbi:uncharacterized protein LOC122864570 isoform X2 [Siniperca chuatsi]|uniref:uncharacterized protein LOC122864570 isoform X2 n=1 Tax=Siniperca chuatsi TaxID=119488 RepID=UPI001CE1DB33|nr:uncharacterized protein LOC122864570 isoform X2 [Siniperca chuatsi]